MVHISPLCEHRLKDIYSLIDFFSHEMENYSKSMCECAILFFFCIVLVVVVVPAIVQLSDSGCLCVPKLSLHCLFLIHIF